MGEGAYEADSASKTYPKSDRFSLLPPPPLPCMASRASLLVHLLPFVPSFHSGLPQLPTSPQLNSQPLPRVCDAEHKLAPAAFCHLPSCHLPSCHLSLSLYPPATLSLFTALETYWFPSVWKVHPLDPPLAASFSSFRSQNKHDSPPPTQPLAPIAKTRCSQILAGLVYGYIIFVF